MIDPIIIVTKQYVKRACDFITISPLMKASVHLEGKEVARVAIVRHYFGVDDGRLNTLRHAVLPTCKTGWSTP